MADEFIRVFPNRDVAPVNRVVKAGRYSEDSSGGGGGSFASILEEAITARKEKTSKEAKKTPEEKLKKMVGMNQYDAHANAFIFRLSTKADYRA
ncbi:MAG: hypothetical protein J6P16_07215 [Eubacterium sp.]|nr:hypothetical protein [Eubacterium sp.]